MPYLQQPVASEMMRCGSSKTLAVLWEISRLDGGKLRVTSHDRHLTYGGKLYEAGILATIGQLKREAGLVETSLECSGLIDGDLIDLPTLKGNRYRGATVTQQIIDWRYPWVLYRPDKWRITRILHDGSGMFRGLLESTAALLQQNAGGRFGGLYDQDCPYNYGDAGTCKKDISGDTYTGVTVLTVDADRPRYLFDADSGTWPAGSPAHPDDFYRQGEVEWTSGDNEGTVQEIAYYTHGTRSVELFLPAPFPVQVGDQFTVRPGCQGTLLDCQARANTINFGGRAVYSPGAQAVLSPEAQGNDP